ncbi:MAG: PAS domain S-box protein [candidate division Zixibacteria bacterium]|nr:PAS domain S-box protein [candidate division Zixibacteria bacterium]
MNSKHKNIREIEEQDRIEDELCNASIFLNTIINTLPNPVFVKDAKHRWILLNDIMCELMGRSREELIGKSDYDIFPKEQADVFWKKDNEVYNTGESVENKEAITTGAGEERMLLTRKALFTQADGSKILIGVITDITELEEARNSLEDREISLRIAQKLAKVGSWEWHLKNGTMSFSEESCQIFGVKYPAVFTSMEDAIDKIVHPEDRKTIKDAFATFDTGDVFAQVSCRIVTPQGTVRWVNATQPEIRKSDEKGNPLVVIGTVQDMTERKAAEYKLLRFKAAMEQSVDGIALASTASTIEFVNSAWARMHGYKPEELVGKDLQISHTESQVENELLPYFKKVLENGTNQGEVSHVTKKGVEFPTWMSTAIIRDEASNELGIIEIARDITEQKRTEAELAQYTDDIRIAKEFLELNSAHQSEILHELKEAKNQADKANKAKSEFLANMSHEIRTPMNSIIGMTNLTLDTSLDDEQRHYLEMVKTSAGDLLQIINSILDFSKIEAGQMVLEQIPFSLREMIQTTAKPLTVQASEKGIELSTFIDPLVPDNLVGDPGRLRQVLINLVGNAIKFTAEGHVLLKVELTTIEEQVHFHFSVEDTGIGIPEDKLESIFESFTQADGSTTRRYGGTGLGTTIAKQLVEMMGGYIWPESPTNLNDVGGTGSIFHVLIQLQVVKDDEAPACLFNNSAMKNKHALIVDGNEANCSFMQALLEHWDMQVTAFAAGEKLLLHLTDLEAKSLPDIIITENHLSDMTGIELSTKVHEIIGIDCSPIILISSLGTSIEKKELRQSGISKTVSKPIDEEQLRKDIIYCLSSDSQLLGEAQLSEKHMSEELEIDGTGVNVLLAEDNQLNIVLVQTILNKKGFSITVVKNGRDAVDAVRRGMYNIILMDVQMPIMGGMDATKEIRKNGGEYCRIPIVAMTAHALQENRRKCLDAGMNDYISKPLDRVKLFAVIAKYTTAKWVKNTEKPVTKTILSMIDIKKLEEIAGGDMRLVNELIDIFINQSPGLLSDIRNAIDKSDAELLCRSAHTFKGSLVSMGAEGVAKIAFALEIKGANGDFTGVNDILDDLRQAYESIEQSFNDRLERVQQ